MILILDNYDSFVYSLARYVRRMGRVCDVLRNDALSLSEVRDMAPEGIVLSPGPCTPAEAGICVDVVREFGGRIPILGVCLGHQAIGEAYGGLTVRAARPVHGKVDVFKHDGTGIFEGLPNPLSGGRYHSLLVELPTESPLIVTARNGADEIMAIQHNRYPVYGVQFHPESILTPEGDRIIENFLRIAKAYSLYGATDHDVMA